MQNAISLFHGLFCRMIAVFNTIYQALEKFYFLFHVVHNGAFNVYIY